MPASRVRGSRVTEGRCIENESVAIRPEVESIEIRSTLVRPDHAAFKFKTLDEGTIVPFHTELRVSVIEGVVWRVGNSKSFPELSFDHDVVLALAA